MFSSTVSRNAFGWISFAAWAILACCAGFAEEFIDPPPEVEFENVSMASDVTDGALAVTSENVPCQCCCEHCQRRHGQSGEPAKTQPPLKTCCCGHEVDWSKVPATIRPAPKTGFYGIPPTGPGYYSLADALTGTWREKPPKTGYLPYALMGPGLFDADFRYVESIPWEDRTLVERLKRIHMGDCWMFSTGGNAWVRYMNEHNARLTTFDNSYTLTRVRTFGDLSYGDSLRVYGEYLWADAFSEELAPLGIDVNLGDIQNLFADVRLFDYAEKPVYARVGRQEMLLGSQRLISTVDWTNTRRRFDGVRLMRRGDEWDFDAFALQFVPALPRRLDKADASIDFGGTWLTYRGQPGHVFDFYYLYFQNEDTIVQQGLTTAPVRINTFGSRWNGDRDGYLWDLEGALQLGERGPEDLVAGMGTVGIGRSWKDSSLKPVAWLYYDYASGDANPGAGEYTTFHQLFGFGHYYFGWLDLVGRQNIQDLNAHLYLYPASWITCFAQYHHFWLNQGEDALYGASGGVLRRDPTGASGTNVGDEIDLVFNFHLTRYSDFMVGYSRLFGGGFLEATSRSAPNLAADAELFHAMYQLKW